MAHTPPEQPMPAAGSPPSPPPAPPPPPAAVLPAEQSEMPRPVPRPPSALLGPAEPEAEAENFDAFAHEPPFRPRRNRAKLWTIVAVAAALLMLAATAAIMLFDFPGSGGRLAVGQQGTPLKIEGKGERARMASGNELLTVSGRISNPTDSVQRVPPIRAELRDAQGRAVYTWPISPPVSQLQPGATATFNQAEVDVPRGATAVNLSFGPPA